MKKFLLLITAMIVFGGISFAIKTVSGPHWGEGTVNVYIQENSRKEQMKRAFNNWQNSIYSKTSFKYTDNQENAKIIVKFSSTLENPDEKLGEYKITTDKDRITKAQITILDQKGNSDDLVYATMLHEIGHILGLGHDPKKEISVMYSPVKATNSKVSSSDVRRLYHLNDWTYATKRSPGAK